MARVPYVTRDELDAEGQEIYDRIRRIPRPAAQPQSYRLFDLDGSAVAFPECYAGEPEGAGDYPGGP